MKTFNRDRSYDKLNKDVKRNIDIGIKKLRDRMNTYINQNKTIENICGDSKLIHDVYTINEHRFYVYKCRIRSVQLRLLYTFDTNSNLIIISHYIKETPFNKVKDYFNFFESECKYYMSKRRK